MPHFRKRCLAALIAKEMKHAPCLGIMGMRQVGKSTLLKEFAKTYCSFDEQAFLFKFQQDTGILQSADKPLALDEMQKCPMAFDALKFAIDQHRRPGQFLVSGSVRFSSRRQIRESLTGRISLLEAHPLTLAECHEKRPSEFVRILGTKDPKSWTPLLKNRQWAHPTHLVHYLRAGGLPGICFKRDEAVRASEYDNHLETLLGRDIHLVYQTQLSLNQAKTLVTEIAKQQGLPLNKMALARMIGVSQPTVKKTVLAMEGIFLLRPYGNTYFLEDCGLSHHLVPVGAAPNRFDWIRLVYHELRVQLATTMRFQAGMRPYQTRGGIDIPFLLEFKNGRKVAICIETETHLTQKTLKSLSWAQKRERQLIPLVLTVFGQEERPPHRRTDLPLQLPISGIF